MNSALTATVAVAGLIFSLSFALLLEELLFGIVFRLMACSRRITAGIEAKKAQKALIVSREGEPSCSR
jgi:hypothetical protein